MYDISDGWFTQTRQIASPNFNERPENTLIIAIIIHSISLPPGCFTGDDISLFFTNSLDCNKDPFFAEIRDVQVSSHLLIRRNGELIQYVSFLQRAWHAGQSLLEGETDCNNFSIGIELEGTDNSAFEEAQYARLNEVLKALMKHFPTISPERIVGHSQIAPGRKTDPGSGFEWQKLLLARND